MLAAQVSSGPTEIAAGTLKRSQGAQCSRRVVRQRTFLDRPQTLLYGQGDLQALALWREAALGLAALNRYG